MHKTLQCARDTWEWIALARDHFHPQTTKLVARFRNHGFEGNVAEPLNGLADPILSAYTELGRKRSSHTNLPGASENLQGGVVVDVIIWSQLPSSYQ